MLSCLAVTSLAMCATASALDVTYQYFRWTPTKLRDNATGIMQASEFQFIDNGVPRSLVGVTVTNPGGNNPGAEGPDKLIDLDTGSKWLSFNILTPLVFQFPAPVTIDTYNFATANDVDGRDPVSWTFEGSINGTTWVSIDSKSNFATTTARQTFQSSFPLGGPAVGTFTRTRAIVANGQATQLTWTTANASAGGVSITPGVGVVASSGTVNATPSANADTIYTLSATNNVDTASASVFVRSVPPTTVNFRYVRFTHTKLRNDSSAFGLQLSEFTLLNGTTPIIPVAATNPGGDFGGNESPDKAIDGDINTKWLDKKRRPLILDLGVTTAITGYTFGTGNDAPDRDPIRWYLEGSINGTSWAIIDRVDFDFPMPEDRNAASQDIPLPARLFDPVLSFFVGDAPKLITGQPLVLSWDAPGATSITINNGVGTIAATTGSVAVNPTVNTTYSFIANGPAGTTPVSSSFTTEIINPAVTTINYTSFDIAGDEIALLGSASIVNDFVNIPLPGNFERLRLNADVQSQTGSTWFRKRINVSTGFQTFFNFQINSANNSQGGDGMAFMIQDNPAGTGIQVPGEVERGLPTRSLNVRIDTFTSGDRLGALVEVLAGTTVLGTVDLTTFPAIAAVLRDGTDLTQTGNDDAPYEMRIDYVPGDLDLYFNGVLILPDINVDLAAIGAVNAAGRGYAGFTGRSGFFFESHDVTRWLLTEGPPSAGGAPLALKSHVFNFTTDQLTLTWTSSSTKSYKITRSNNLLNPWVAILSAIPGAPAQTETSRTINFTQGAKDFFRIEEE